MRKMDVIKLVFTNLWRMKARTILTTVGVVIGTAAVVTMVSLGAGMQQNLTSSLQGMGSLMEIEVLPTYDFNQPMTGGMPEPLKPLTEASLKELSQIEGIIAISPVVQLGDVEMTFGKYHLPITLDGIDTREGEDFDILLESGRFLFTGEQRSIVVGYKIPELIQSKTKAIGKGKGLGKKSEEKPESQETDAIPHPKKKERVDLQNKSVSLTISKVSEDGTEQNQSVRVRIVGVASEAGGQEDVKIYAPLKMVEKLMEWREGRGRKGKKTYESLKVRVDSAANVDGVQTAIEKAGYSTFTMKQMVEAVNGFSIAFQAFLGGIGAIALLVSAFGIMNTMIMSIYERTKEIGIMKVIGASVNDIRSIFLLEAGMIGFLGGVTGLLVGWLSVLVLNFFANLYLSKGMEGHTTLIYVPWWLAFFALSFATLIGVLAGLYPSIKAAKQSPLEAIRHT